MTRVTFENGTIRDVISKASKVAPTKGSAFDKAAGIVMEVNVAAEQVIVKATNIELFYTEIADALVVEGKDTVWRVPSVVFDGITSKLPIGSGKTVTLDDTDDRLSITSGRMRAKVGLISTEYYPVWGAFDSADLEEVSGFGARMAMVEWAAAREGEPPITGVHFNGELVMATDRHKIAISPCVSPVFFKPITVPAGLFTPLMKNLTDVMVGITENQLLLMPDSTTQIRAAIYGHEYPPAHKVLKRDETAHVTFKRSSLLECIDRAMVMGQRDRSPLLRIYLGDSEIAVFMDDKEVGLLGDIVDVPGYCEHSRFVICFSPSNLTGALNASPNEEVTLYYHPNESLKPVRIDGGSGYEVLIMPRKNADVEGE